MLSYPNEIIKLGYSNPDILKQIKLRLNELGFGALTPDIPNFGLVTMEAIKKFQKANHLIADGEIGELTWARLFNPITIEQGGVNLQKKVLEIAKTQLYVREATNHNDGKEVGQYLASIGLGQGYSWCMAYFFWLYAQASKFIGVENPVPKTGKVLDCYDIAKKKGITTTDPKPGDQFIMDFGGGKGHTGLITDVNSTRIFTNEGNTSADPSYAGEDREGNGVFERNRNRNTIKAFVTYA